MGMLKEFKKFAMRGNIADMAIGIMLGAALGKIVTSLVNDVVMPPIGLLLGNVDFSHLVITLRAKTTNLPAVTIEYGAFINTVINFVIIAFVIFIVVKQMNKLFEKPQEPVAKTTKSCGKCCSEIDLKASRCPFCTSDL